MEYASNDPIETHQRTLGNKRTSLNLFGDANHGYLLERCVEQPSLPISSIYINPHDRPTIQEFIESDPHRLEIGLLYEKIIHTLDKAAPWSKSNTAPEFSSDCASETELLALIIKVCRRYGAEHCFYHRFTVNERSGEVQRHQLLVGGRPDWAQHYVARHRHLNDPALAYALVDTLPLRGSSVRGLPAGHWLAHQPRLYGLTSNVFFPTHQRGVATIGMLHVGGSAVAPQGEVPMWRNRRCLRGFAAEVLDWYIGRERSDAMKQWALNVNELAALELVVRGGNARHVANELGMDERSIYILFAKINKKMGCAYIKTSANKAAKFMVINNGYIKNT